MEKKSEYRLRIIGRIEPGPMTDRYRIVVKKDYIRGLKQLEHFSHLHVFTAMEQSRLAHFVVEITELDEETGIIEVAGSLPCDGRILDLKPYMPSEDRFTGALSPDTERPVMEILSKLSVDEDGFKAMITGKISVSGGNPRIILKDPAMLPEWDESFDGYINILWYFNRSDMEQLRKILVCKPPYDAPKTGVFASRSPVRPNPIGLTTVKVRKLNPREGIIEIDDTDAFEGTPVLAVEAYRPDSHRIDECRLPNWLAHWPREAGTGLNACFSGKTRPSGIRMLEAAFPEEAQVKEYAPAGASDEGTVSTDRIEIRGARQNNLKDVDVSIPVNNLTVITGVSGSGKSSLAFDTLYAESRRRFMQSMSSAARSTSEQLEKPDADRISNLFPAIAVDQKNISRNPRSTVGSISEVYAYLRLLFARFGTRYCGSCGTEIDSVSAGRLSELLSKRVSGMEIRLLPGRELLPTDDRVVLKDILSEAYESGSGYIEIEAGGEILRMTDRMACTGCERIVMKMTPSMFSYNSPAGMCRTCGGLGRKLEVDPCRVVDKPYLSLLDGASPWYGDLRAHLQKLNANWMRGELIALAEEMRVDLETAWEDLPDKFRTAALYGTGEKEFTLTYSSKKTGRTGTIRRPVGGAVNHIKRLFANSTSGNSHELYKQFLTEVDCPDCGGERLAPDGRAVYLAGLSYPQAASMSIVEAIGWADEAADELDCDSIEAAETLLYEFKRHLEALRDTGLHYLTLDRPVTTISGGEAQRIKLAGQLGCGLSGLLYVLDEPSIGLHPRDHKQVIKVMKQLRDEGNTVVVVEHDAQTMLEADHLIDIGPGAGTYGGRVVAEGSPEELMSNPESVTGRYLSGREIAAPARSGEPVDVEDPFILMKSAQLNNLKGINVSLPIGRMSCITGVSGSGKTSLILGTLVPGLLSVIKNGSADDLEGGESFKRVIHVDQGSIGRSPRSVPATYIGFFDEVRNLFAGTPAAKKQGYKAGRFSFNDKKGRCSACEGLGRSRLDMSFMPDTWIGCSECGGRRYNPETLSVKLNGKSIYDVLEMDVLEALSFFNSETKLARSLGTMRDVGLEYLKLGQSSATLSGGEAQRIKLASELTRCENGQTLYVFDEPTTGLHFSDIEKLGRIFRRLTEDGNTVVVIEHNMDIISMADWIVDLGPEGGKEGGRLIGQGSPDDIAGIPESYTGQYLKKQL